MNAATTAGMPAIPVPATPSITEPPARLLRLLPSLVVAAAAFDVCFWNVGVLGLSLPLFVLIFAGLILVNRDGWRNRKSSLVLLGLLIGAAVAAVIETSTTNLLCLLILTVLLAGDTWFGGIELPWGRWMSQMVTCFLAPGRVFWLSARLLEAAAERRLGGIGNLMGAVAMTLPALFLALIFGFLLATGNMVFGNWAGQFFHWFWNELALFLDPTRIFVWGVVAFLALPLLRPAQVSSRWWNWVPRLPRLPEVVPTNGALVSSSLVLIVLNFLFAIANSADAMFLWTNNKLPAGVTYSAYVHNGVNSLTITVLLSAFVLAGIFQQNLNVARKRYLKILGLIWIAQNVFLLISVLMRLKLYIEAYDMTVERLSVMIFLLLVAAGYGLLTIKIVREKSLPWLIGGCAFAVFTTFYITQFLNLAGWSADYNVARWEKDKSRNLDLSYIQSLGAAGWPALKEAQSPAADVPTPRADFTTEHWRQFCLRAYWNRTALADKK